MSQASVPEPSGIRPKPFLQTSVSGKPAGPLSLAAARTRRGCCSTRRPCRCRSCMWCLTLPPSRSTSAAASPSRGAAGASPIARWNRKIFSNGPFPMPMRRGSSCTLRHFSVWETSEQSGICSHNAFRGAGVRFGRGPVFRAGQYRPFLL